MLARLVIAALLTSLPVAAAERPRVALVLAGGGARGAAHVGALRVLERERVPVDLVVGTSMGAVVGGLYASGLTPDEIESALASIDWVGLFDDEPPRKRLSYRRKVDDRRGYVKLETGVDRGGLTVPTGLVAGQKLAFVLQSTLLHTFAVDDFDALPIPFRAVATDLESGRAAVLAEGSLAVAIRASMSVPLAFAPVEIDGRTLVDGGIVDNLPLGVARDLGAERLIVIDVTSPLGEFDEPSIFNVAGRTIDVMTLDNVRDSRRLIGDRDLLITPEIDVTATQFARFADAIADGERAVSKQLEALRGFSVSAERHADWRASLRLGVELDPTKVRIDEIVVEGLDRVSSEQLMRRISTEPGSMLDLDRVAADLERIYQIGEFERVEFRIEPDGARRRLVIDLSEKSWGPGYLRYGLALEANLEGDGFFRLFGDYTRTQLNRLGAEWKTVGSIGDEDGLFTELYQPLDYDGRYFVAPSLEWSQRQELVEIDPGRFSSRLERSEASLAVGARLSHFGELRLGASRGLFQIQPRGELAPQQDFDTGGAYARIGFDLLDQPFFPRAGWFAEAEFYGSREGFGADLEYDRLEGDLGVVLGAGKGAFLGLAQYGSALGSDLPDFEEFTLGGFLDQTGLDPESLRGDHKVGLQLVYYREIGRLPRLLGSEIYLGGAAEVGQVWSAGASFDADELRATGTLLAGFDSVVGPLYVGLGIADDGQAGFYLFLGNPFGN